MNFKLSKEAEKDAENIWLYTHENWSIEQAERYLNLIFDEIDYLCLKPKSGFEFGNMRDGYWRSKVKSHYIYYKINLRENELEIIRILHEMMHVESQLGRSLRLKFRCVMRTLIIGYTQPFVMERFTSSIEFFTPHFASIFLLCVLTVSFEINNSLPISSLVLP